MNNDYPHLRGSLLAVVILSIGGSLTWANDDHKPYDRFMTRARQLTFEGRRAGEGYFSFDSKNLIFQSERYEGNPFFQIYTMDLSTGRTRLISPGVGRTTCSFYHPDKQHLQFASTHLDPNARQVMREEYERRNDPSAGRGKMWDYDKYYDIFVSDPRGRNLKRLTDTVGYDAEGAFSPDGKHIVFCSMRDAYPLEKLNEEQRAIWEKQPEYFAEIYIMDADGSNQRKLTDWPGYDGGPFFTYDGSRVIWRHFDENGLIADIYTIKPDGTDRRRLTDFKCMSWAPFMHPSNEYAIFASNKHGFTNFELFIVDAMGQKQPVRVTYSDGFDGLPVFSPDGKSLCWTTNRRIGGWRKAQLFFADWNHDEALKAIRSAPLRGTEEPMPTFAHPHEHGWPDGPPPTIKPGLTPSITDEDLYEHVKFLASDKLEGRMTGSRGAREASEYIAQQFKQMNLIPLGDGGTYFQEFEFPKGIAVDNKNTKLWIRPNAETMNMPKEENLGQAYQPLSFSANGSASGLVAFAGYGLVVPEDQGKAGYDSYAGLEVQDKVVLILDDVPNDVSTDERIRLSHYASPRYKALQALKRGAAGMLIVTGPHTPNAGQLMKLKRNDTDCGLVAASISIQTADKLLQSVSTTIGQLQEMLDGGKIPEHFANLAPQSGARLQVELTRKMGKCRNVVGLLPSISDYPMADEYVVVGAHYDHIGHGETGGSRALAGEEGQIHNGADDNASGTATVLELAAHFTSVYADAESADRPQRNMIFALWSGEEIGVIGSSHFVRHAPCPLGQIAAYVNFDMVGRLRAGNLILQAVGSSPDWLGLIEKVNVRRPLDLIIQEDPYLPTDTHEFYPAGIPVLSFFTDVHDEYNRPVDDAETLNYPGLERIALLARELVGELASAPSKPKVTRIASARPRGAEGMRGRSIFTGTVPDFTANDVEGMKISGVQGDSPAEKAGLVSGDIIVELAGHPIKGLEDYAVILRALKPDVAVDIKVLRNGKKLELKITPVARK